MPEQSTSVFEELVRDMSYETEEDGFHDMVKEHFPKSYRCALRIRDYLQARVHYEVGADELTYLTIHIQRNVFK